MDLDVFRQKLRLVSTNRIASFVEDFETLKNILGTRRYRVLPDILSTIQPLLRRQIILR